MESNAGGSVEEARLDAAVSNARDLGNGCIMANASWEQPDANGTLIKRQEIIPSLWVSSPIAQRSLHRYCMGL
jgi:hypothetical protein